MTALDPTAPTTFTVGVMEFTVHGRTLTLGQKELLHSRSFTQHDPETGFHFCVDCLSDLPHDRCLWFDHVCTDTPVCLENDTPAPAPAPAPRRPRRARRNRTRTTPTPDSVQWVRFSVLDVGAPGSGVHYYDARCSGGYDYRLGGSAGRWFLTRHGVLSWARPERTTYLGSRAAALALLDAITGPEPVPGAFA